MGEIHEENTHSHKELKKKIVIKKAIPKIIVKRSVLKSTLSSTYSQNSASLSSSSRNSVNAKPTFSRPASLEGRLEVNTPNERTSGRPYEGRSGFSSRNGGGRSTRPPFNRNASGGTGFNRNGGGPSGGKAFSSNSSAPISTGVDRKAIDRSRYKSKKDSGSRWSRENQENEVFLRHSKKKSESGTSVPKSISIMDSITIADLAKKMNLKASDLISKLFNMGMMVTINQVIDSDTAVVLASEYDCEVQVLSLYEETVIAKEQDNDQDLIVRPPVVTIMGHVDHGKTKLLDKIHSLDIVAGESGGITQHIGAYSIDTPKGKITFLDTPGHEAFTMMRARGAQVTDIVVLVVAADDGVMPQTVEAIQHAQDAKVPIIVAINKIDLPAANPEKIKQKLSEYQLVPEEWGGQTSYVEISAKVGTGIESLLEIILLQAEIMEITSNPNKRAAGHVIEARVDPGRGIVCSVLIEEGTLKVSDSFVGGVFAGRVRALFDWKGQKIDQASPATPVEVLGFDGLPSAGDPFQVTESERVARQVGEKRQELRRQDSFKDIKRVSLSNLYDQKENAQIQEFKVIIKGDVQGSVEALKSSLEKLSSKEIVLRVVQASAGAITESDVNFAMASGAVIIGFHVRPTNKAQSLADASGVEILRYNIIYDAIDSIRSAMEGMLSPDLHQVDIGEIEVRQTFKIPKIGLIAGCYVTKGLVKRNTMVRVMRDGVLIHEGKISSLKRVKDEVKEVSYGYECGIGLEGFQDLQVGDLFEVYEIHKVARKL